MDWNSAFEETASGVSASDFLGYWRSYSEVSSYKNNSPIKTLSYEELRKESMAVVKRMEEEPILVDAAAAIERLKELRNLNTSLHAQLKAQKELMEKQGAILSSVLSSIGDAIQYFIGCGIEHVGFVESADLLKKGLQETSTKNHAIILAKINGLEGKIVDTREKIMPLVELIKVGMDTRLTGEERDTLVAGNLCSVCFEHPVNRVYDGCGHTICGGCVEKINRKECHICRTNFKKALTLYLG
jgi:hypothetical protein